MTRCVWPHCRNTEIDVIYFKKPLCALHWKKVADEDPKLAAKARTKIGLPARLPKVEVPRTPSSESPKPDSILSRISAHLADADYNYNID